MPTYLPEDELGELAAGLPAAELMLGGPTRQPVAAQRADHLSVGDQ